MSTHKTITLEAFKRLNPCWLDNGREADLDKIGARQTEWSALDILRLPNDEVSAEDRLWSVRWLIDEKIMHEFACRCAEEALKLVKNPDPRSVAAIAAKRAWLRGEINDAQLAAAWAAARDAALDAAWAAALDAARDAALDAAWAAAWDAAWAAAWAAARAAARDAALAAARDAAWAAALDAARENQIKILIELIEKEHEHEQV